MPPLLHVVASHWLSPVHKHTHTLTSHILQQQTDRKADQHGGLEASEKCGKNSLLTRMAGLALPVVGTLAVEVVHEVAAATAILTRVVSALVDI